MAADLLTYNEFLAADGKATGDVDSTEASRIQFAITGASQAVRQYLDRDLTLNTDSVQGARTFRYWGHGTVDIDDCTSVTQVAFTSTPWQPFTRVLDVSEWVQPIPSRNLPVSDFLELWTNLPFAASPEMGFKWNADRYGYRPHPIELDITAVWGWPSIPQDIKMATVWVVGEFLAAISPYTAESIEGYSHSFGSGRSMSLIPQTAITVRAQSLLDPYQRVNV